MTSPHEGGRHEAGRTPWDPPAAADDVADIERSVHFRLGALEVDFAGHRDFITGRVKRLEAWIMGALEDLQAQVSALVAEDGVVIAEIQKLQDRGDAVSAADVQAAADTIKGEVARLTAAVGATGDTAAASGDASAAPATEAAGAGESGSTPDASAPSTDSASSDSSADGAADTTTNAVAAPDNTAPTGPTAGTDPMTPPSAQG